MNSLVWAFLPTWLRWLYIACTGIQLLCYAASYAAFQTMTADGRASYMPKDFT